MSDARKRAEEALAKWEGCRVCQTWKPVRAHALSLASALRALLAASAPAAGEREEIERRRDSIEIEREWQRSMARALAEINRLSRLDVAIALAPGDEVAR